MQADRPQNPVKILNIPRPAKKVSHIKGFKPRNMYRVSGNNRYKWVKIGSHPVGDRSPDVPGSPRTHPPVLENNDIRPVFFAATRPQGQTVGSPGLGLISQADRR